MHMIDSASGAVVSIIEDAHTAVTYLQWSPVPCRIGEASRSVITSSVGQFACCDVPPC